MTARHKKVKELTPLQKRVLKVGALTPVSAGFVLTAASGAFAACPGSQTQSQQQTLATTQQSTQSGSNSTGASRQQEWHGQQGDWQGDFGLDGKGRWQGQWTLVNGGQNPVRVTTDSSNQREWHGRQGDWQGDWRLDDKGQWQGQWTPVQRQQSTQQGDQQTGQQSDQKNGRQPGQQGDQQTTAPTANAAVDRILQLVNQERAKAGLSPMTLNPLLSRAAQGHSDEMARTGIYRHTGPDGSSPGDRIKQAGYSSSMWAENIHHRKDSPEIIMADWMKSPGHRANILNANLKEIGIGMDASGSYWTQNFGARR
ncbi:CAP domain-containing protein [Streptomyces sp. NPDC006283]|uniref:CAP domain-containing protein n=1 Tax=Streptomyces sp. NPDC006283 TaxID=3156741 RepID=UPI0033A377A3